MGLVGKIAGLAAGLVKHAAWYVSYHMSGDARRED
jgi:hypothetical protein